MVNNNLLSAAAALVVLATTGAATAGSYGTETFDTPVTTGATQAPDTWYTDRYAPESFEIADFGGDSRLKHSIDASDGATSRPGSFSSAFYNTQGRKYDLMGVKSLSIDLYVDGDWETSGRRMAGIWGTGVDATDTITAYPIIEFASSGTAGYFQYWDGAAFQTLGLPSSFAYDEWYTLQIDLDTDLDLFTFTVGDLTATNSASGTVEFANVILQGHNTTDGVTYDIYWDNLTTAVPSPSAMGLGLIGGLGLIARRRRGAKASA